MFALLPLFFTSLKSNDCFKKNTGVETIFIKYTNRSNRYLYTFVLEKPSTFRKNQPYCVRKRRKSTSLNVLYWLKVVLNRACYEQW